MNEIVPTDGQLPALVSTKNLDDALGSGDYIPYIILQAQSGGFSGPPDSIPGGNFVLVRDKKPESLGVQIDVFLIEFRMLAMRYGAWGQERVYDIEDERWEPYKAKATTKNHVDPDGSRYWWGVEYLMWVPAIEGVATFYCNNPTQRRVAKEQIKDQMRVYLTFKQHWIETPAFQWWGFDVFPCDVEHPEMDVEECTRRIIEFKNPQAPKGAEEAPAEEQTR